MKTNTATSPNKTLSPQSEQPPLFITAYSSKLVVQKHFDGEGRTKQAFKDECDINQIMARYQKTGVIDFINKHQAQYGDVTGIDFQQAMETIASAQSLFNDLPSTIRTRFKNDPAQFMDFVHDPANAAEMHAMGLMRPDYQPPAANAASVNVATPQAPVERSAGSPPNAPQEQPPKAE